MNIRTEHILVENLKCGGCASTIDRKIGALTGVSQVQVDLKHSSVSISVENAISRHDLTEKLKSLGYPEQGDGGLLEAGKSYISCMMGKI